MSQDRLTVETIRSWPRGKSLLALTAYDYSMARLLDEAGVDILHVGDTLGMVTLGYPNTTHVTIEDVEWATRAVARGRKRALVTADLPIHTYDTPEDAVVNGRKLMQAGADGIKLEGGREILPQIRALIAAGVPVQGHLGMLPQHVLEEGGYKRKGKTADEAARILADSLAVEEAGAFSIVFELVVSEVAEEITGKLKVPSIGIGSGPKTTGQVQVVNDVFGMYPWFVPAHAKQVLRLDQLIAPAIQDLRKRLSS